MPGSNRFTLCSRAAAARRIADPSRPRAAGPELGDTGQKRKKIMPVDIQHYEKILQEKRQQLLAAMPPREAIAIDPSPDILDQLQASLERERAVSQLHLSSQLLHDIDAALARIRRGAFGLCQRCRLPIAAARLNAVPWTSFCIRCQQILDRRSEPARSRNPERLPYAA
jgi:DnaK suppressor protein